MARLIVNPQAPKPWVIELKPGVNSIGRGADTDFPIPDPSISSRHCEITVLRDVIRVKDLRSTNGTFIDGRPVTEALLRTGQLLRIGGVNLRLETAPDTATPGRIPGGPIRIQASVKTPGLIKTGPGPPPAHATQPLEIPDPPPPIPLSASVVAGPPVSPRSPQVSVAVTAPAGTQGFCKSHPRTQGRYFCPKCKQAYCDLCVTSRTQAGALHKICQRCGADCAQLQAFAPVYRRPAPTGFFKRLPQAFLYALKGNGFLLLACGTLVMVVLNLGFPMRVGATRMMLGGPVWGLIFLVLFLGFLFSYMENIIHATVADEPEPPPLPNLLNAWDDVVQPCLTLAALLLTCWLPVFLLEWATAKVPGPLPRLLVNAAQWLAFGYFPMAFLSVIILGSFLAANPWLVIRSIFRVPVEYLVTLVLLYLCWALRLLGDRVLPVVFPRGLGTRSMAKLLGFVSAEILWAFVGLYLLTTSMHILGLLFACKKEKLGWLRS